MLQNESLMEMNRYVAGSSRSRSEPEAEPQPEDEQSERETRDDDVNEIPENVPDDWLDPKPFDPAGR